MDFITNVWVKWVGAWVKSTNAFDDLMHIVWRRRLGHVAQLGLEVPPLSVLGTCYVLHGGLSMETSTHRVPTQICMNIDLPTTDAFTYA